jgi:hypothetical protein
MASRVPSVHWFYRDLRLSYVLLVWVAFCISLFVHFGIPDAIPRNSAAPTKTTTLPHDDSDVHYTGSIISVPARGDWCRQTMLDNRTGKIWDNGYVNCYDVVTHLIEQKQSSAVTSVRLNAISSAFRREDR